MKRALFIGRFQPFHNAHLLDIKQILKEVDEVIIAIGSSQEKNTLENPFSYNERKQMIINVLKINKIKSYRNKVSGGLKNKKFLSNYKIYPVPDLYNDKKWVNYIKKTLPKYDYVYSGNTWTLRCFKKHDSKVKKIKLIKGVSSTIVRNMIIKNKNWKEMVPEDISKYIEKIKGVERVKKIYSKE